MKVISKANIQGDSVQPSSWGKIQEMETKPDQAPQFIDTGPKQPPVFTRNPDSHELPEMANLHLEAFVEPRGDPTLGGMIFTT